MGGQGIGGILNWAAMGRANEAPKVPQVSTYPVATGGVAGGITSPQLGRWTGNQFVIPYLQQLMDAGVKPGANAIPHWTHNPDGFPFPWLS